MINDTYSFTNGYGWYGLLDYIEHFFVPKGFIIKDCGYGAYSYYTDDSYPRAFYSHISYEDYDNSSYKIGGGIEFIYGIELVSPPNPVGS